MLPEGQVYHCDWSKTNQPRKSTIAAYMREETSKPEVTHSNIAPNGDTIHWLKTFGMDTWYIRVVR